MQCLQNKDSGKKSNPNFFEDVLTTNQKQLYNRFENKYFDYRQIYMYANPDKKRIRKSGPLLFTTVKALRRLEKILFELAV